MLPKLWCNVGFIVHFKVAMILFSVNIPLLSRRMKTVTETKLYKTTGGSYELISGTFHCQQ